MSPRPDRWILHKAVYDQMIDPVTSTLITRKDDKKIISYGPSSYGYDIRCAREFKIFTNVNNSLVDPKDMDSLRFVDVEADHCIIPPNSFVLTRSVEYLKVPHDILVLCVGKSTYARCGLVLNTTPLEPGWEGHITLEISNTTPLPAKVYANEGVAQLIFLQGEGPCDITYDRRGGKYQGQRGITLPRV
jgi:dCTP deaminase